MQEAPNQVLFPRPADVLLSDGSVALIRPLEPADAAGLRTLHEQVSDDSIRLRFFTGNRQAGLDYVEHLLRSTEDTVLTLVVVLRGKVVAVATAEPLSPDSAEVAFLVADSVRGRGIGSLLLEHLAASCRVRGIRHFVADVLSENNLMLRVFADAGFAMSRASEHGVVVFDISTAATPDVVRAADAREFQSEANSLRPLLYPRSVAVVGVRSDGGGIGAGVLDSIVRGGFTGRVYVVHPRAASIAGQSCHRALIDLPEPVDVVLIAVPPAAVAGVLEDAAEAGAGSAVVITSGFGELDPRGRKMQQDLLRIAREHSLRLVGPNCLGVLANDPSTRLNATFTRATPPPGGLAIASQSGGVGIVMLDLAQHLGLGIHSFVSLGNKADVSGNDLLSAWYDDAEVTAAALYLESFGNAPKFARIARRFAERKPLLAVAGGRSTGGVRAGASHTAAAAAPAVGVDALFAQAGVTACSSAEAMARTALLLSEQPLPHGPRVGVVSNAGGIGVLAADSADGQGLVVPELSAPLAARLRGLVNGTVGTSNPIDLGAGAEASQLLEVTSALLSSGEVDSLLVALVATSVSDPHALTEALSRARSEHPLVPVVLVAMGGLEVAPGQLPGITVFDTPDDAVGALAHAVRRAAWLDRPREDAEPPDEERAATASALAQDLTVKAGPSWLDADQMRELLSPYGLVPTGELVSSPLAAAKVAARTGFPVVVKVADPDVVHKTDRGLVRVGLQSGLEVSTAVRAFEAELNRSDVPVLVQPTVPGVEMALGVVRDPGFGPLVMVAAGGVATEVWNDRTFLLPPVTRQDAGRALQSLRIWPLLNGYRGSDRVDLDALEQAIQSLGQLAVDVPELAELDLNPVMANPRGAVLVDAKVRLAEAQHVDAGVPRQLRTRTPTAPRKEPQ